MRLLAIETAYDICGVAVIGDGGTEALVEEHAPRRHNEILAPSVQQAMGVAGREFEDLDGIALSVGPGAYTGLRIGMSFAKGLAFGTGLPVIPVPTLPSLLTAGLPVSLTWVVTWSHGEKVFALRIRSSSQQGELRLMDWAEFVPLALGEAVAGYVPERFLTSEGVSVLPTPPSAEKVGRFALEHRLQPAADLATLLPDYLHEYQERLTPHAHS